MFQFTHPGGVRRESTDQFMVVCQFQFTHPGGVRPRHPRCVSVCRTCFNSRTREGCDCLRSCTSSFCLVSIHAPGRGATQLHHLSLHRSTFQFTHPGGVRRRRVLPLPNATLVSIHAPGRGATSASVRGTTTPSRFNSRTREGCDVA